MKIAVTSFTAQYLPYKWKVVLDVSYIDFHIPYLGSIIQCINFQFRLLNIWQIRIPIVHLILYFNIFIPSHKETYVEYFYLGISYTILINESDVVPY